MTVGPTLALPEPTGSVSRSVVGDDDDGHPAFPAQPVEQP